jgi:hypothetical protein
MNTNKNTDRINAFGNLSARGFKFFTPRALRLLGALGMGQSTAHAQNSTFANRTTPHTAKVCKRAVFLPTHPFFVVTFSAIQIS